MTYRDYSGESEVLKYKASCPVCGRVLVQAAPHSDLNMTCPKCKTYLCVTVENEGIHIIACESKRPQGEIQ